MTARKKRPARDDATPEKIKSGRKTGKTPSKDVLTVQFYADGPSDPIRVFPRAPASVKQWLAEKEGLDRTKMATQGFGAKRPVAPNRRRRDRRVSQRGRRGALRHRSSERHSRA